MAKVNFRNSKYILSVPSYALRPKDNLPEIAIMGKSNVGKSSLINRLLGQKIAFSSKKAGKTKLLSYFLVDDSFYLVDTPGYGYTAYGNKEDASFAEMMEPYFDNPLLKGALLLVDGRRGSQEEDRSLEEFLSSLKTLLVFTKADKLNQSDVARLKKDPLALKSDKVVLSSLNSPIEEVRRALLSLLD